MSSSLKLTINISLGVLIAFFVIATLMPINKKIQHSQKINIPRATLEKMVLDFESLTKWGMLYKNRVISVDAKEREIYWSVDSNTYTEKILSSSVNGIISQISIPTTFGKKTIKNEISIDSKNMLNWICTITYPIPSNIWMIFENNKILIRNIKNSLKQLTVYSEKIISEENTYEVDSLILEESVDIDFNEAIIKNMGLQGD